MTTGDNDDFTSGHPLSAYSLELSTEFLSNSRIYWGGLKLQTGAFSAGEWIVHIDMKYQNAHNHLCKSCNRMGDNG